MKATLLFPLILAALFCALPESVFSQTGTRTVTGFAFIDANGNGVYDEGEEILDEVEVFLINENGDVVASTVSDANGNYTFPDVPYGTYTLLVQIGKNSYVQSPPFVVDGRDEDIVVPIPVNDENTQFGPSPLLTAVQEFILLANSANNPKTDNPASGFAP